MTLSKEMYPIFSYEEYNKEASHSKQHQTLKESIIEIKAHIKSLEKELHRVQDKLDRFLTNEDTTT